MEKLCIVIPAYNESKHLASILHELKKSGHEHVIVVDDGSFDDTYMIAKNAGVIVVRHSINRGVGAATQTGLEAAKLLGASYVITFDADAQHHVSDIAGIFAALSQKKGDIVIGSRFLQKNTIPFLRRCFNWFGNLITYALSGIWISDSQSGFKGFNKKALESIEIRSNGYEFATEIILKGVEQKLRFSESPIHVTYSDYSLMKGQNFAGGIKTMIKLVIRSLMK